MAESIFVYNSSTWFFSDIWFSYNENGNYIASFKTEKKNIDGQILLKTNIADLLQSNFGHAWLNPKKLHCQIAARRMSIYIQKINTTTQPFPYWQFVIQSTLGMSGMSQDVNFVLQGLLKRISNLCCLESILRRRFKGWSFLSSFCNFLLPFCCFYLLF